MVTARELIDRAIRELNQPPKCYSSTGKVLTGANARRRRQARRRIERVKAWKMLNETLYRWSREPFSFSKVASDVR